MSGRRRASAKQRGAHPSERAVSRPVIALAALVAVGLAVATNLLEDRVRTAPSPARLLPFVEYQRQFDDFWDDNELADPALLAAISRARGAVVRAHVTVAEWHDRLTHTRWTTGSGFVIAGGELLLLSAHQGRPAFTDDPGIARVEFATPDGRALVATLIDFVDADEDWALCRIHNPFELPLDALELGTSKVGQIVAALGYPGSQAGSDQVGVAPDGSGIVAAGADLGAPWPQANALAAIVRRIDGASSHEAEMLLCPPRLGGMSGGPVIDASGRAVAINMGFRVDAMTFVNDDDGAAVSGSVVFQATATSAFQSAVAAARSANGAPLHRLIDRVLAVAQGLFVGRSVPSEFGLTVEERIAFGMPASDAEAEAEMGAADSTGGTWSVFTSTFQQHLWHAAQLRELRTLGPDAVATFRRALDAACTAPTGPEIDDTSLGYVLDACEKSGITVGLDALLRLLESRHERIRRQALTDLPALAHDQRAAYRIAVDAASTDVASDVRAAATEAASALFLDLRAAVADWSSGQALERSQGVSADERLDAACALAQRAGAATTARLREMATSDPDDAVRAAAGEALAIRSRQN